MILWCHQLFYEIMCRQLWNFAGIDQALIVPLIQDEALSPSMHSAVSSSTLAIHRTTFPFLLWQQTKAERTPLLSNHVNHLRLCKRDISHPRHIKGNALWMFYRWSTWALEVDLCTNPCILKRFTPITNEQRCVFPGNYFIWRVKAILATEMALEME